MHSERLLEHFRNPRHAGQLEAPCILVEVSNPVCGDVLRLSVRLESGTVVAARFKAHGCPSTIACGSALAEWLHARRLEALQALTQAQLAEALDGLPPASMHAAALAVEAVREVLRHLLNPGDQGSDSPALSHAPPEPARGDRMPGLGHAAEVPGASQAAPAKPAPQPDGLPGGDGQACGPL